MKFRIVALLSIVAAIASTECMAVTADYNVVPLTPWSTVFAALTISAAGVWSVSSATRAM